MGLHSEFIRKSILAIIQTAAANGTASVGILLADLANLQKVDHLLIGACLHAARDVLSDGLRVVAGLLEYRRELPRLAWASRIDLCRVFGLDFQTADGADTVLSFFDELTAVRHCSRSTFLSHT